MADMLPLAIAISPDAETLAVFGLLLYVACNVGFVLESSE